MGYINFVNGSQPYISQTNLNNLQRELMKLVFPIGSTYITQEDTNPSTILEFGTWERIKGKVLVGLDEDDEAFNTIGKTGGEKTHLLTIDELPSPYRSMKYTSDEVWGVKETTGAHYQLSDNGNQAHNILQPYQVIGYMWIRTA